MTESVSLTVNGAPQTVHAETDTPLLYILRNDLKLKGAKFGCGLGQCGACMVLLDGQPVNSCSYLALQAQGREITTVEGVLNGDAMHPLQRNLLEAGGVQCGFCTPGMIMSATALLQRTPAPTEEEVRVGLSGNLCRCTGYTKIVEAVQRTAAELQGS